MLNQADLETLVALKRLCRRRLLNQANRDDEGTPLTHVAIRPDVLLRILAHVDANAPDQPGSDSDRQWAGLAPVLLVL